MIEIWHTGARERGGARKAYEAIYTERGIRQKDSFYLWLLQLITRHNRKQQPLLLDVACGEAQLVRFAQQRGFKAIGVDLSFQALRNSGAASVLVADGERLPFPTGTFDWVTCIGSLEHYVDPLQGAVEIVRVLRSGGQACVLLPNTFSLIGNIKHVWLTGDVFDDGQPIQRYSSRQGWARLLTQAGLEVKKVVKYEVTIPLTLRDLAWYLVRPAKMAHLALTPFIPTNLAACLVYLCQKA